ncbi:MAG: alpha-glucosidase C-terminal domain-containing protein [Kouleothrix sp.]|nr:alpha-glucosidase C-terminal domain-containing protein [Kouleothrix sp.]
MSEGDARSRIRDHLAFLYGGERAAPVAQRLLATLQAFRREHPELGSAPADRLTERDVILITYGDQFREPGRQPLQTLADVMGATLRGVVGGVHILPFYPYTSDDGFSVIDYAAVDPLLGEWADLEPLRAGYRLMFDAVINHISAQSDWFQAFLRGDAGAESRFIVIDPATDLSLVTRPRTSPLLTPFQTPAGTRYVWTTFSADQIDLNYASPELLLEIVDVLLLYVARGAQLIRLDAIGYLWKEIGTRCIHLPQAHRVVQLFRAALDAVAPGVLLITETNVPHADNISYFGDGTNEAQLVYQFPLAPLVLNAFYRGSARHLAAWASELAPPSASTTFFNFLASHDGIGVVPASGILSADEVAELVARTATNGGMVSYKANPDGTQSPYELNITLFDALSDPHDASESHARQVDRFVAANAIMLALQGVPGIYVHSLFGSHNHHAGVAQSGRARSINREKWDRAELERRLANPQAHEHIVLDRIARLIAIRRGERAFHPSGAQRVIDAGDGLFVFSRSSPEGREQILCVHSVSGQPQALRLPAGAALTDLVGGASYQAGPGGLAVDVAPYQVLWLK